MIGILKEIRDECQTETEWKEILKENKTLKCVKEKWEEYLKSLKDFILPLPFTEDEINYLNSKVIDELKMFANIPIDFSFQYACIKGHLELAKWLNSKFNCNPWTWKDLPEYQWAFDIYKKGEETYSYKIAKWAVESGWCHDIQRVIRNKLGKDMTFSHVCMNGQLEVAKWLISQFPEIDPTSDENFAFRWACGMGHLEVAKWLITTFPKINPHALHNFARKASECRGFKNVVKWLDDGCKNI